jgi:capsular polysaccharide export protein
MILNQKQLKNDESNMVLIDEYASVASSKGLKRLIKKILRRFFSWYTEPIVDEINRINQEHVQRLSDLSQKNDELQKQLSQSIYDYNDELQKQLSQYVSLQSIYDYNDELQKQLVQIDSEISSFRDNVILALSDALVVKNAGRQRDLKKEFESYKNVVIAGNLTQLELNQLFPHLRALFKNSPILTLNEDDSSIPDVDAYYSWGAVRRRGMIYAMSRAISKNFYYLEDGFIRSILSVSNRGDQIYLQGVSFTVDDISIYCDGTRPTRLEIMLNNNRKLNDDELNRAKNLMSIIIGNKLTKYNFQPIFKPEIGKNKKKILVVEQAYNDYSIILGCADNETFIQMYKDACMENPDADIIIKTHPDNNSSPYGRGDNGYFSDIDVEQKNVYLLKDAINPISMLEMVDKVYVVSSQLGFEALMCGKEVHVYGMPFYAGWGLTIDKQKCERRGRKLTLEELFYTMYIDYSFYVNPDTGKQCEIEEAIEYLLKMREVYFGEDKGMSYILAHDLPNGANLSPLTLDFAYSLVENDEKFPDIYVRNFRPMGFGLGVGSDVAIILFKVPVDCCTITINTEIKDGSGKISVYTDNNTVDRFYHHIDGFGVDENITIILNGVNPDENGVVKVFIDISSANMRWLVLKDLKITQRQKKTYLYFDWPFGGYIWEELLKAQYKDIDFTKFSLFDIFNIDNRWDFIQQFNDNKEKYRNVIIETIKQLQPDGLLVTYDWLPFMIEIINIFKEQNIPVVMILHEGVFQDTDLYYDGVVPISDKTLVWGELHKEIFIERGYPKEKISIVGSIKLDNYKAFKASLSRDDFFNICGLDEEKKTIMYCCQFCDKQYGDQEYALLKQIYIINDLRKIAEKYDYNLIIRNSPAYPNKVLPPIFLEDFKMCKNVSESSLDVRFTMIAF